MKHKKEAIPLASLVHKLIHNFIRPICFLRYPLTDVRDSNRTNITALFLCIIVPTEGFEPSTLGLKILCSATELRKRKGMIGFAPTPPWLPSQVLYYWATFLVIWQKLLVVQGRFELTEPAMGIDLQSIFFNRLNIAPSMEHIPNITLLPQADSNH